MARFKAVGAVVASISFLLVAACSGEEERATPEPARDHACRPLGSALGDRPTRAATQRRAADPDDVRAATAVATVRHLAGDIGPRPGTSPAYFRAAAWVERRLRVTRLGRAPAVVPDAGGRLLGRPGPCGSIGQPRRHPPRRPTRASVAGGRRPPRHGPAGTRRGGQRLGHRRAARGRRGAPDDPDAPAGGPARVRRRKSPVGRATTTTTTAPAPTSPASGRPQRRRPARDGRPSTGSVSARSSRSSSARGPDRDAGRAARRGEAGGGARRWRSPTTGPATTGRSCATGLPGVRLGSTPYAGYHSPGDVPAVVDPAQLRRTARTVVSWLAP